MAYTDGDIVIVKDFDIFKKIITYSSEIVDECIISFNKNGIFLTPAKRSGTIVMNCFLKKDVFDDLPDEDVNIALNLINFKDILKSFKDDDVELIINDDNIVVKNGKKEFTLKALYDDYVSGQRPIPAEYCDVDSISIDSSFIIESVSDASIMANSVYIGIEDNILFIQQKDADDMDYINKEDISEYDGFKKLFSISVLKDVLKFVKLNKEIEVIQVDENPFFLKIDDDNIKIIIAIAEIQET